MEFIPKEVLNVGQAFLKAFFRPDEFDMYENVLVF